MKTLINFNYDATDEVTSGDIAKIAMLVNISNISEAARKTDIPSQFEMFKLADDQCALVIKDPKHGYIKKYANYNRDLTELNTFFFLQKAGYLPDEINKTAAYYLLEANKKFKLEPPEELKKLAGKNIKNNIIHITSIDPVVYQMKLAHRKNEITKTAIHKLKDEQFALPKQRKYPIINEETIKTAMMYFGAYNDQLDTLDRINFAVNTIQAAKSFNIEPSEDIKKYSHLSLNNINPDFKFQIRERQSLVLESEIKELYDDILEKSAELKPIKLAALLRKADELAGLKKHWGNFIEDPIISTLDVIKEASIKIGEITLTKTALTKLCAKDVSKWIDGNTLKELQGPDGLDVFASLPKPTQDGLLTNL